MEYIYAALLLHKAGKEINEDNIKKVVEAAGIQPDEAKIKALVAALEEVDIEEAISKAPTIAVGAPAAAAPAGEAAAGGEAPVKEEEKKEDEGKKEEEAAAGLGALFGGF